MDVFANLAMGFGVALSPFTLMLAVVGCFLGTIIGALPGLGPSMQAYLFEEAKLLYRAKRYDGALAVLRELYDRDPKRPRLDQAMGATTEKLVGQYLAPQSEEST